jgi:ribosomal protein S11
MGNTSLKAKIAALRAKTTSAGCTEAEAMAAAELAARLMAEHGLSAKEIEMTEAATREATVRATWRADLVATIATVTNCAAILTDGTWLFIGRAPGPEIAVYLKVITFRAVERELAQFKTSTFYRRRRSVGTRRQAAADFVAGMVTRLRHRLRELFAASVVEDLRLEAQAVLDHRFRGISKPLVPVKRDERFAEAAGAGWRAGSAVPLNHGVSGGLAPLAIGGPRA